MFSNEQSPGLNRRAHPCTVAGLIIATLLGSGMVSGCRPDAATSNDRGVALMGRYDYHAAEAEFRTAVDAAPKWLDLRINLAIAILNRQNEGDDHLALDTLADVLDIEPDHPRALYTSAILRYHLGEIEAAKDLFAHVAKLDPDDAYAAYYLGLAHLQTGDNATAADWLLTSAELDPYLLSAYYTGSQALRRAGRDGEADRLLQDYLRLRPNPAAHVAEIAYRKMGSKAEAIAVAREAAPAPSPPEGPLFAAPQSLDMSIPEGTTMTTADLNGDGVQDIALGGTMPTTPLAGNPAGGVSPLPGHPLAGVGDTAMLLWGDMDDDGLVDVVLCTPTGTRILRQANDAWTPAQILGEEPCTAGAAADADHDGDLDVLVVGPRGNELHSNNRDGTFRRLAAERGMEGNGDARQVLFADLDADLDLDIVVVNRTPPHDVWQNDRTWEYAAMAGLDELRNTALAAVTIADTDADGHREIFALTDSGALLRWHRDGRDWIRRELNRTPMRAEWGQLDVADFNGDGRPELLRALRDGFTVIDPHTGASLFDQRVEGLSSAIAVTQTAADGPAVVVAHRSGISTWPPGTGRHGYLSLTPTGRSEGAQMRSNASGIGALVRARVAGRWTVMDRLDYHSGPGQSLQPLSIGLGGHRQADFVEFRWPDGVSQTELELAGGAHHAVAEIQRQLASCPVLFAWNGHAIEFVSDVLGVAGIGFLDAPGRYAPPRPVESFLLDARSLAPRDDRYILKLGEPMEENVYLDAARLTVYDLPPGWDMVLDERLAVGSATPTGRPIPFRRAASPKRVTDNAGRDVTELAARRDHRAPPPGEPDPRFIGLLAKDHTLTFEFAEPLHTAGAVLVADGWVEYPYSQTVFAAWQAGLRYRPPTLEGRTRGGEWKILAAEFGYPAGMPRTMALPLPDLPPEIVALRLSSNMEIYWDRVRVVWEEPLEDMAKATLPPVEARVARAGFAKRTTGPQRRPHYDYANRSTYWDAKAPAGLYTAYGDASELAREVDGALAIISSGEEVHLEFEALPDPHPGHSRYYRITFHGWAKDMDLYTLDGGTVGPLPVLDGIAEAMLARRDRLHARYNVRFREGL